MFYMWGLKSRNKSKYRDGMAVFRNFNTVITTTREESLYRILYKAEQILFTAKIPKNVYSPQIKKIKIKKIPSSIISNNYI